MFNIVNYPPGFGECTFCKKHDCGVNEEGEQYWLHSGIELDQGGNIVIGYKCAKLMADNMNITVKVVEKQVLLTPNDEQIGDFVRKAVKSHALIEHEQQLERESLHLSILKDYPEAFRTNSDNTYDPPIEKMNRDQLKLWLKLKQVDFIPQWGEERLREEALKHV